MYLWRPSERGKLRRTKDLLSLDPRLIASSSLDRMHVFVECTRSRKKKRGEGKLNLDRRVSFYVSVVTCNIPGVCKRREKMFYLFRPSKFVDL